MCFPDMLWPQQLQVDVTPTCFKAINQTTQNINLFQKAGKGAFLLGHPRDNFAIDAFKSHKVI